MASAFELGGFLGPATRRQVIHGSEQVQAAYTTRGIYGPGLRRAFLFALSGILPGMGFCFFEVGGGGCLERYPVKTLKYGSVDIAAVMVSGAREIDSTGKRDMLEGMCWRVFPATMSSTWLLSFGSDT